MKDSNWTRQLPPLPGELLSSCLARNAHAHGSSAYRFLNLLWQDDPVWNRDFDRDPGSFGRIGRRPGIPDWLDDIALRIGVSRDVVEAATLAGYRTRLAGSRRMGGDTSLLLSAGIHHRTRTRHALQFCPDCLEQGTPHFRKEWRLAFSVVCLKHGKPLAEGCGRCGAPVAPHRSFTGMLTGCHACGGDITKGNFHTTSAPVPLQARALQDALLRALPDGGTASYGPWPGREVFDAVRCLLAVSAPSPVSTRLRRSLGLGEAPLTGKERLRFEQCRHGTRATWLETVAMWMSDWPNAFHIGARAAGLTRRSFARAIPSPAVAEEVRRLPAGIARDRSWVPVLDEPVLRRLRRQDPAAYSQLRARRILLAVGWEP